MPHATLAEVASPHLAAAFGVAAREWQPFGCWVAGVEVVRFRPVEVVWGSG